MMINENINDKFLDKSEKSYKLDIINMKGKESIQCKECNRFNKNFIQVNLNKFNHKTRERIETILSKTLCLKCFIERIFLKKI